MTIAIEDLPKIIILEAGRGVRIDVKMDTPACEIEARIDQEAPGKSFVLMLAHKDGQVVQRVRVAGRTKVLFDPEAPGEYVFLLTNPMAEPLVVHWEVRPVGSEGTPKRVKPSPRYDPAYR
jgi:hypothetical protein